MVCPNVEVLGFVSTNPKSGLGTTAIMLPPEPAAPPDPAVPPDPAMPPPPVIPPAPASPPDEEEDA